MNLRSMKKQINIIKQETAKIRERYKISYEDLANGKYEHQIVRKVRFRRVQIIAKEILDDLIQEGVIPPANTRLEKMEQMKVLRKLVKETNTQNSPDEISDRNEIEQRRTNKLLKKRKKSEKGKGRPSHFLLSFDPANISEQCDIESLRYGLTPVYSDGSLGDPKLYPFDGPF